MCLCVHLEHAWGLQHVSRSACNLQGRDLWATSGPLRISGSGLRETTFCLASTSDTAAVVLHNLTSQPIARARQQQPASLEHASVQESTVRIEAQRALQHVESRVFHSNIQCCACRNHISALCRWPLLRMRRSGRAHVPCTACSTPPSPGPGAGRGQCALRTGVF